MKVPPLYLQGYYTGMKSFKAELPHGVALGQFFSDALRQLGRDLFYTSTSPEQSARKGGVDHIHIGHAPRGVPREKKIHQSAGRQGQDPHPSRPYT
jgi:hypothetical protein